MAPIDEFVQITKHYGYIYEYHPFFPEEKLYVIYRADKPKTHQLTVAARRSLGLAIRECEYLERLNAPKFKEEENNG